MSSISFNVSVSSVRVFVKRVVKNTVVLLVFGIGFFSTVPASCGEQRPSATSAYFIPVEDTPMPIPENSPEDGLVVDRSATKTDSPKRSWLQSFFSRLEQFTRLFNMNLKSKK